MVTHKKCSTLLSYSSRARPVCPVSHSLIAPTYLHAHAGPSLTQQSRKRWTQQSNELSRQLQAQLQFHKIEVYDPKVAHALKWRVLRNKAEFREGNNFSCVRQLWILWHEWQLNLNGTETFWQQFWLKSTYVNLINGFSAHCFNFSCIQRVQNHHRGCHGLTDAEHHSERHPAQSTCILYSIAWVGLPVKSVISHSGTPCRSLLNILLSLIPPETHLETSADLLDNALLSSDGLAIRWL